LPADQTINITKKMQHVKAFSTRGISSINLKQQIFNWKLKCDHDLTFNNNNKAFYSQASWGTLEMIPHKTKHKKTNKSKGWRNESKREEERKRATDQKEMWPWFKFYKKWQI
jgi:hypothetical protein